MHISKFHVRRRFSDGFVKGGVGIQFVSDISKSFTIFVVVSHVAGDQCDWFLC